MPPEQPPPGWASPTPDLGNHPGQAQQGPPPPGTPWPYGGYGQPPPPRKSHTGLIIGWAIGVVLLLLVGAGAVVVLLASSDNGDPGQASRTLPGTTSAQPSPSESPEPPEPEPATFRTPDSLEGYSKETGSVARRLTDQIKDAMRKAGPAGAGLDKADVALYMKGATPLVFMGFSGSEIPQMGTELARSPSNAVDQLLLGAGVGNPSDHSSGTSDSVMRCGQGNADGTRVVMCAWANRSALLVLQGIPPTSTARLASLTRSFREASLRTG